MRLAILLLMAAALLGKQPTLPSRPGPIATVALDAGRVLTNDRTTLTAHVSGLPARRLPPRVVRGEGLASATIEAEADGWRVTLVPDYHAVVRGDDGMSHLVFEVVSGADYVRGDVLAKIDNFSHLHPHKLGLNSDQLKASWIAQAPVKGRGRWVSASLEIPDDQVSVTVRRQKSGGMTGTVTRRSGPPRPLVQNRLVFTSSRGETDYIPLTTM